ncbi:MAG TPA: tRNA pseudouridine(38-40) synthase TruA [Candidatus Binataceae bacterium]
MRFRITLEYDGTEYAGWQLQSNCDSIQARLEAALGRIFGDPIRVHGSGRTDAGVHALGQVAAFAIPRPMDADQLQRALNALTPADIVIRDVAQVAENFDPRRDARSRVYEYRVLNRAVPSAFENRYAWLVKGKLDVDLLNRAAKDFIGEHDFAAFRTLGSDESSTVRQIWASQWRHVGDLKIYRVEASGFLRRMVRTMVAAMIDQALNPAGAIEIAQLIAKQNRALAPGAAPACGLFLVEVRY